MRYLVSASSEYRRVKASKDKVSASDVADRLLRKERNTFRH